MIPNKKNFCGGNFQDWLEVMLIDRCNGKCKWCVEKKGYHPKEHIGWEKLAKAILKTNKKNIILLGGEPTLYHDLTSLIKLLSTYDLNIYITTNGSLLTRFFSNCYNLYYLTGINISIHSYDLYKNYNITGLTIYYTHIKEAINYLKKNNVIVRLNCNLIKGHIDSKQKIEEYINFAKEAGANSIRFAELKNDEENFINLHSIFGDKYGINNEPFGLGCNTDVEINGMPINFRQMCGLQTPKRNTPINPEQYGKQVLYYDGKIYDGWQISKKEGRVTDKELTQLLNDVANGKISTKEAGIKINKKINEAESESEGGCQY